MRKGMALEFLDKHVTSGEAGVLHCDLSLFAARCGLGWQTATKIAKTGNKEFNICL